MDARSSDHEPQATPPFQATDGSEPLVLAISSNTMGNGDAWGPMWSGMAGLGHILLTIAFIMFFRILGKRIRRVEIDDAKAAAAV